ncbi:hypothetical protein HY003_00115 [Candidatus Saccharibacteria bacterium]|nr:hypothetical protein [Candidatus Saccharibacteria bacterium]MBI3337695.1 hypothetical protein [Candidatus Saccharibacteria bacterium]
MTGLLYTLIITTILDLRKIVRSQSELFRAKTVLSEGEVALATTIL